MSDLVELGTAQLAFYECRVIYAPTVQGAALVSVKLLLPYRQRSYPEGTAPNRTPARWIAGDCAMFPEPEAAALIRAGVVHPFPAVSE